MFEGFSENTIETGDSTIFFRYKEALGTHHSVILLLHGHPRTSATWHLVAPSLVKAGFSVVVPDLRGYGRSRGPTPSIDHSTHSKRAAANDLVILMNHLGHDSFAVIGHDRGALVAFRLAMDYPDLVSKSIFIDDIPITEHMARLSPSFAKGWWHWWFFALPEIPENIINSSVHSWYQGDPITMGQENYEEWKGAIENPIIVKGMLEDYRAGLSIDLNHEEHDRACGKRLRCDIQVLWSSKDDLEELQGDPRESWGKWSDSIIGKG